MQGGTLKFIVDILGQMIATIGATLILSLPLYLQLNNPVYVSFTLIFYAILAITFLFIIAIILNKVLENSNENKDSEGSNKNKLIKFFIPGLPAVILIVILTLISIYLIYPIYIPPFEITEPKDGSYVQSTSTVSGIGAIPGSPINVYVIDKYGQTWHVGTANPSSDGLWKCNSVNIGQYGNQYAGQSFTLFANLTKGNKSYETPHIDVIRS